MLELEMSHIIKNRRYKKQWIYLGVILFVIICILIYIKVQMFIEERNHENWVNHKEQEFKPVIELVYDIMRGEKKVPETSLLFEYDISHYAGYQDACNIDVEIKILDIEEILANKKYIIKVIYSRELTDKNGKTVGGSIGIDADWTVEKGKNGMWEIVDIYELV